MYLFNTTYVVDEGSFGQWSQWIQEVYLPNMLDAAPQAQNDIYELEKTAQTAGSRTFSCQWRCPSIEALGDVMKCSAALNELMAGKYGEKCLYFNTMMKKAVLL